jgi:hypothetical protein
MYEHKTHPLLPWKQFLRRLARHGLVALAVVFLSLAGGTCGYRYFEGLSWTDALLNASMILGGMGPVNPLRTQGGKLFASFYALFSGIVFIAVAGILVAPAAHRMLHRLHLESESGAS